MSNSWSLSLKCQNFGINGLSTSRNFWKNSRILWMPFIDFFLFKSDARIRKEFNSYLYSVHTYMHSLLTYTSNFQIRNYKLCYRVSQGKVDKVSWLREMKGFKHLSMNSITSNFCKNKNIVIIFVLVLAKY